MNNKLNEVNIEDVIKAVEKLVSNNKEYQMSIYDTVEDLNNLRITVQSLQFK
ncbi:hypothetical protein AB4G91_02670 [Macrococcoides goetzii]|uniref:hypothetical protein n=1 Tax=Macrococcus sp. PK TaxID=2801919 RepID=UPI001F112FD0|nr:hypothetical protein [Macrococcus sp. PK]MCH4984203.1 hypothetical protein [Macrococcus sp. PK]